jgi:hypothetical protein
LLGLLVHLPRLEVEKLSLGVAWFHHVNLFI